MVDEKWVCLFIRMFRAFAVSNGCSKVRCSGRLGAQAALLLVEACTHKWPICGALGAVNFTVAFQGRTASLLVLCAAVSPPGALHEAELVHEMHTGCVSGCVGMCPAGTNSSRSSVCGRRSGSGRSG